MKDISPAIIRKMPKTYTINSNSITLNNAKKAFGNQLIKFTPRLAKQSVGKTLHVIHGQGWFHVFKENSSKEKRAKCIGRLTIISAPLKRKDGMDIVTKPPDMHLYLYKGGFVTGSGADPVFVFQ